jgi:hypothetical protein
MALSEYPRVGGYGKEQVREQASETGARFPLPLAGVLDSADNRIA